MEDLIGIQFGKWTVLKRDYSKQYKTRDKRWICQCSCENKTVKSVMGKYLKNGKSTSCGCNLKKDKTGERYEHLVIEETIYGCNGRNRATYRCKCDCGNEIFVPHAHWGKQKSCGCARYKDYTGEKFGMLTVTKMLYDYNNGETYCSCNCDCGNTDYIVRVCGLTTGNTTSCGCKHSPNLVGKRFGMLVVEEEVINNTSQKMWKCKCDCGNEVIRTSAKLKRFYSCGCLQNKSFMEQYVKTLLEENNIEFIPQKRFDDCKDIFTLPFDFYLPNQNIVIECDGVQHFEPVEYFGGEAAFIIRQKHDKIKTNYCLLNNIKLIRFPYFLSQEEIKETLLNNILKVFENPVTTTAI